MLKHSPIAANAASHVDETRIFSHADQYCDIVGHASLRWTPKGAGALPARPLMGTFSREDEQSLLIGCGAVLLGIGIMLGCIGFSLYMIARWAFG